jgi:multisubunit Na+/H+ antiporter MnhC subunit
VLGIRFVCGIVITSEARNLLLFAAGTTAAEKAGPSRPKAVRDDNSEIAKPDIICAALNNPVDT